MSPEDFKNLVSDVFFYGYPLVADLDEVVRFTQTVMGSVPAAPFNQFSHARSLGSAPCYGCRLISAPRDHLQYRGGG